MGAATTGNERESINAAFWLMSISVYSKTSLFLPNYYARITKERMFIKEFEVRWSDLDANGHLANSAYVNFMSHTRMAFLTKAGFAYENLGQNALGPVVFFENIYYFREVLPGIPVRVSLELGGLSEDGMFFEFLHKFYDNKGRNLARCEMMGGWIDLKTRKLSALPPQFLEQFKTLARAPGFRWLSSEDTRVHGRKPEDL
jgi:acyl-CoA thioester hydrolase